MNYKIDNNLELKIVNFEQAQALKELGFPQDKIGGSICKPEVKGYLANNIVAPTLELVAKWLREEKEMDIIILPRKRKSNSGKYIDKVYDMKFTVETLNGYILRGDSKTTYEEALGAGIDAAIEILKGI